MALKKVDAIILPLVSTLLDGDLSGVALQQFAEGLVGDGLEP